MIELKPRSSASQRKTSTRFDAIMWRGCALGVTVICVLSGASFAENMIATGVFLAIAELVDINMALRSKG